MVCVWWKKEARNTVRTYLSLSYKSSIFAGYVIRYGRFRGGVSGSCNFVASTRSCDHQTVNLGVSFYKERQSSIWAWIRNFITVLWDVSFRKGYVSSTIKLLYRELSISRESIRLQRKTFNWISYNGAYGSRNFCLRRQRFTHIHIYGFV